MVNNVGKGPGEIFGRKHITYPENDDFGWRDITGEIVTRGVGATDPVWTQLGSGPFYAYAFTVEEAASGTAYQHMVTESDGQQIADLDEPDGLILCKITRLTNGGSEDADTVYLLTADLHYQSTNQGTYNKAPNFYL